MLTTIRAIACLPFAALGALALGLAVLLFLAADRIAPGLFDSQSDEWHWGWRDGRWSLRGPGR